MQVYYAAGDDTSYFDYRAEEVEDAGVASLHDCSAVETRGEWARFKWVLWWWGGEGGEEVGREGARACSVLLLQVGAGGCSGPPCQCCHGSWVHAL